MNFKKACFAALAFIAIAGGMFACNNQNEKVIRIAYYTGALCGAPVHIAWANGYFEEELSKIGFKVERVPLVVGESSAEIVASGKIDAGYDLLATLLQPIENGLPITFTSGIHTGCTKYYVKKNSGIKSVKDLRGKKIGVPGLSDSAVMGLKRKLLDAGIGVSANDKEVDFIAYTMSDLPMALENGAVDVIGIHDPVATQGAEAYGFEMILDTGTDDKFMHEYCCQSFVTTLFAKKYPEAAAAYTRAIQRASAFVSKNPKEAAKLQIEGNYVGGDLDFNARLLSEYNFKPSKNLGKETLILAAKELQTVGILRKETDIEKFIEKAYTNLDGVPDGYTYDIQTGSFHEIN